MEKYGFIYVWYDKMRKMYYVGRHWGAVDDNYICSSVQMLNNYKNRPQDFKRRIVSIKHDKMLLIEEEQRWLNMIKKQELGDRYYNKTLKSTMPSMLGRKHSEETKEKMRKSATGKVTLDSTKEKLRKANIGKKIPLEIRQKMGRPFSEERKQQISQTMKEFNKNNSRSKETRDKIRENSKRLHQAGLIGNAKLFKIQSPSGEIFEGKNLKLFCMENDINYGSIINKKKTKGWILLL